MPLTRPARLVVFTVGLAAVSSIGLTTAASVAGGDWTQWRGPQRDGVSVETGLLTAWPQGGPAVAWTARGLGAGFSNVSISGGKIFSMGDRRDGQYVFALDEATSGHRNGPRTVAARHAVRFRRAHDVDVDVRGIAAGRR